MSTTWQQRIDRAHRVVRRAGLAVVVLAAGFGFAAAVQVFVLPAHPSDGEVVALTHRIDNRRDAAGQFAADFVAAVLAAGTPH